MADLSVLKTRAADIEEWFKKELLLLRTGRATVAVLDAITVESYGSRMPIAHVGAISTEDARTIRVVPWDKSQIKAIEEAVRKADIGLSVTADGEGLRIIFPELTSERRQQVVKLLGDKQEEARVSLRKVREEILGEWKRAAAAGALSEDEHFKAKEELQKIVDKTNARFDMMASDKEKDINK